MVFESKARTFVIEMKYRIIHGRAEIWNFSSSVQLDISRVSAVNEISTELNTPPNLKTLANSFQVSVRFHCRYPGLLMTTIEYSLLRVLVKETFTLVFISVDF